MAYIRRSNFYFFNMRYSAPVDLNILSLHWCRQKFTAEGWSSTCCRNRSTALTSDDTIRINERIWDVLVRGESETRPKNTLEATGAAVDKIIAARSVWSRTAAISSSYYLTTRVIIGTITSVRTHDVFNVYLLLAIGQRLAVTVIDST